MKKIVLILFSCFILNTAFSQSVIFSEDFNYSSASNGDSIGGGPGTTTALGDTIWKKHSGTATGGRAVKYSTSGLSYLGYSGSGVGGAATFVHTTGSADINAYIGSSITTGSVYTAFLLRVDSTGGNDTTCDYFFHYCDLYGAATLSNFRAKLFVCAGSDSTTKFKIGINKGLNAKPTAAQITAGGKYVTFSSSEYNIGQTYLVIVKYTFNASSGDDVTNLFVLSGLIPLIEPTPDATSTDATASDLAKIQSIAIRQGSIGKTGAAIDGIRVFQNWDLLTVTQLPIKLNSFNAIGLKDVVNVNWNVLCTENSCNFYVERSIDGVNFETISTSNATTTSSYSITDKTLPSVSALYYRLKIVNATGKVEYSNIQKVVLRNIKLTVSPNPASDELLINATSKIQKVILFNMNGKTVLTQNNNSNFVKVPVADLANGTYIVKITTDGSSSTETIVIKH